ncbi:purine and uridine phosphorylase [Ascobolus immersus RN42]|uniref:Purine and uridine phosphorylase n=1 Tax=Ascobolus immersus RN42 TaxID=1160509 RepID=A0A3N4HZH4_ASCIM|nr:purine and uridine phosphorylase [Ascobolus immersus RN42]
MASVNSTRKGYSPYANATFTVGWICALPCELEAAKIMLDEVYGRPQYQDRRVDDNHYTLGRIEDHNIVLTVLGAGQTGTSAASVVATHMQSTFRNIRYGLMVGIGGGIPPPGNDKKDSVRLGDVVVSIPRDTHGGVMQYDFGKEESMGFEFKKHLNSTPASITKVLSALMTSPRAKRLHDYVILPRLQAYEHPHVLNEYQYPGDDADILFEFDCGKHPNRQTERCFKCNNKPLTFRRTSRPNGINPLVFYGTIASGDSVIKNAVKRDRIRGNSKGALCVEMEAAGLMNYFPCVVIRGICDYADSTKNDNWQNYAAITAAAYARVLLEECYPEDPLRESWDMILDFADDARHGPIRSATSSTLRSKSSMGSSSSSMLSRTSTAPSKLSSYEEVEHLPPDARLMERKRQGHLAADASKYRVPSFALSDSFSRAETIVDDSSNASSTVHKQDLVSSDDSGNQQRSSTLLKSRDPNKHLPHNNDLYRVAWICMVTDVYDSALLMLDEIHGRPSLRSEGDINQYTLGSIKRHNIVVAPLGAMPILRMMKFLMNTFPRIEISVVVGTGAGFPTPAPVRIGDVVVGFPIPEPDDTDVLTSTWDYVVENENESPDHRQLKTYAPVNVTRAVAALRVDLQDRDFLRAKVMKPQLSKPFVDEKTWKESLCSEKQDSSDSDPSVYYGRVSREKPHIIEVLPYDRSRPDHLLLPNLCNAEKSGDLVIYGYPLLLIEGVISYTSTDGPLGIPAAAVNRPCASLIAATYARALLLEMRSKWPDRDPTRNRISQQQSHGIETGTSKSSWTDVSSKPFSILSRTTQGSSRMGFQLVDQEVPSKLQTVDEESVSSGSGFFQGVLGMGKSLFSKGRN